MLLMDLHTVKKNIGKKCEKSLIRVITKDENQFIYHIIMHCERGRDALACSILYAVATTTTVEFIQ